MIKPYVITQSQVKSFLNISDTSFDTQIDLYIPIVSDDITRENGICNQDFLFAGTADTAGTDTLSNVSLTFDQWDDLYTGSVIQINGEDGVILSFDESAAEIVLESALTKTDLAQDLFIRNFPYGSKPIISQMILYKIREGSVSGATFGDEIASRNIGPVSVSFAGKGSNTVNGYGYPSALFKSLATIRKPRFF